MTNQQQMEEMLASYNTQLRDRRLSPERATQLLKLRDELLMDMRAAHSEESTPEAKQNVVRIIPDLG